VADCNEVVLADIQNYGNVGGEIEMHWKRNKFIKIHQVVLCDLRNVKDYNKSVIFWPVDVGSFHQEKVGGLINEVVEIALRGTMFLCG
jgi:hypothetical protein